VKNELKCAFTGKAFWVSFIVLLISYFSFSIPSWVGSVDWGAEFRPSAFQQAIEGVFFGGVLYLMPFCATAAYAASQVTEITSRYINFKMARTSVMRYGRNKLLAAAVSGAVVLAFAYAFHAMVWNVISLPYDPKGYPYQELPFRDGSLFDAWHTIFHALPVYLLMTVGIGVYGAVWAVCGLAIAVWIPDQLLALTIPACIHKLWAAGLFRYAVGWDAPYPADLFYDDVSPIQWLHAFAMYAVFLGIAIGFYYWGLRRRVSHAG
jgi:hypothetical protein